MSKGYCLKSPSGKLVVQTFSADRHECWDHSFGYLYRKAWMKEYWKQWDASIAAAAKRGWRIVSVEVREHGAKV